MLGALLLFSGSLAVMAAGSKPLNDDFPGAEILALPASIRTENLAATSQPGEPRIVSSGLGGTLWWTWRAPAAGRLNLKAFDYFISLGIFEGDQVDQLTLLSSGEGTVSAAVEAGGLYRILVDAWAGPSCGNVVRCQL